MTDREPGGIDRLTMARELYNIAEGFLTTADQDSLTMVGEAKEKRILVADHLRIFKESLTLAINTRSEYESPPATNGEGYVIRYTRGAVDGKGGIGCTVTYDPTKLGDDRYSGESEFGGLIPSGEAAYDAKRLHAALTGIDMYTRGNKIDPGTLAELGRIYS